MRSLKSTTSTSSAVEVESASAPMAIAMQRSPWHSPVPYLFGGLAAMLGLIAFALLILACSYWKLSGQLNGESNGEDLESGEGEKKKERVVYEEQCVVIMAGDDKPSFLAMPVCSRSAKLVNFSNESDGSGSSSDDEKLAAELNVKGDHLDLEEVDAHTQQSDGKEANMSLEHSHELHLHHETKEPESSSSS